MVRAKGADPHLPIRSAWPQKDRFQLQQLFPCMIIITVKSYLITSTHLQGSMCCFKHFGLVDQHRGSFSFSHSLTWSLWWWWWCWYLIICCTLIFSFIEMITTIIEYCQGNVEPTISSQGKIFGMSICGGGGGVAGWRARVMRRLDYCFSALQIQKQKYEVLV